MVVVVVGCDQLSVPGSFVVRWNVFIAVKGPVVLVVMPRAQLTVPGFVVVR